MMDQKKCRPCLLREGAPEEYEKYVAGILRRMKPSEKVSEALYEERLLCCRTCDDLMGGTCMVCGCLVEIRAMQKKSACPSGRWTHCTGR